MHNWLPLKRVTHIQEFASFWFWPQDDVEESWKGGIKMFATPTSYCVTPGGRASTPFSRLPSRASTILRWVLIVMSSLCSNLVHPVEGFKKKCLWSSIAETWNAGACEATERPLPRKKQNGDFQVIAQSHFANFLLIVFLLWLECPRLVLYSTLPTSLTPN